MIDPKTIEQIQRTSVEERLQIIELILDSLKQDIQTRVNTNSSKPFVVRHFSLGQDIQVDRDELYTERAI